ncbi:hypothetical protein FB451DRAFT_1166205 [Mycena latifolia]|nr:hypothetical protein FB451DRAFT_1166205 [Mycena latifolia]
MSQRSQPARTIQPPLSAGLAIVPLVDRATHPAFQAITETPEAPETEPDMSDLIEGQTRTLTPLKSANSVYFKDSLARLKDLSGREYVPSDVKHVRPKGPHSSQVDGDQDKGASRPPIFYAPNRRLVFLHSPSPPPIRNRPPPHLYKTLVHVGLKNPAGESISLALALMLPHNPFASQIIRTLWATSNRVQLFSAKWATSETDTALHKLHSYSERSA